MFCNDCGTKIPENSKFCLNCGAGIDVQQPKEKIEKSEEVVSAETTQMPPLNQGTSKQVPVMKDSQKPTIKKLKKVLKNILSATCCLSIFASIVLLLAVLSFRASLAPDRITYILDNIDVKEIVKDDEVQESLVISLDEKEAAEIYEKSTIKKFVKTKITAFADYILRDSDPVEIKADEIVELVKENEELIETISGEPIYGFDYDNIEVLSEDIEEDDTIELLSDTLKSYCSATKLALLILATLIFCALLWIIRRNYDALLWGGMAVSLSAFLFAVAGLVLKIVVSNALAAEGVFVAMLAKLYLSGIMTPILIYSGCFLVIGAVLMISYFVTKMLKKARA